LHEVKIQFDYSQVLWKRARFSIVKKTPLDLNHAFGEGSQLPFFVLLGLLVNWGSNPFPGAINILLDEIPGVELFE
jgi:hypothetical protein